MQTNTWSLAAVNGLILAMVTIVITLVQTVLEPGTVIKIFLWAAKLGLSIWLLYYFIRDYAKRTGTFHLWTGIQLRFQNLSVVIYCMRNLYFFAFYPVFPGFSCGFP